MIEEELGLVDQPSSAPTEKVVAAGLSGAVVTILVYAADLGGLDLPPAVAGALTVVGACIAGYFKRNRAR